MENLIGSIILEILIATDKKKQITLSYRIVNVHNTKDVHDGISLNCHSPPLLMPYYGETNTNYTRIKYKIKIIG